MTKISRGWRRMIAMGVIAFHGALTAAGCNLLVEGTAEIEDTEWAFAYISYTTCRFDQGKFDDPKCKFRITLF